MNNTAKDNNKKGPVYINSKIEENFLVNNTKINNQENFQNMSYKFIQNSDNQFSSAPSTYQ